MRAHPVLWSSPTPLWGRFGATIGGAAFRSEDQARPALLRFATDAFMDQLIATLDADPRQIGNLIARPETWRVPTVDGHDDLVTRTPMPRLARALVRARRGRATLDALRPTSSEEQDRDEIGVTRTLPLKLYQPAHQRYYLVAANLVCGIPGFPDRAVATGGREQIGFVLRRLLVPIGSSVTEEFAFVKDASGASWQRLPRPNDQAADRARQLGPGEEVLPLFPMNFHDDVEHPRRMLAGMVPVGRREEYMSTIAKRNGASSTSSGQTSADTSRTQISERLEQFRVEVSEPWKNLIRTAYAAAARINETPPTPKEASDSVQLTNQQLQGQSWLVLLNLADYLSQHLPQLMAETPASLVSTREKPLYDWLTQLRTDTWPTGSSQNFATSVSAALRDVQKARDSLEGTAYSFPHDPGPNLSWPATLFLLAGVSVTISNDVPPVPHASAGGLHTALASLADVPDLAEATSEIDPTSTDPTYKTPDPDPASPPPPPPVEPQVAAIDVLVRLVVGAIDKDAKPTAAPPLPFARQLREALKSTNGSGQWFVIRCVYVRCDCGPLQPTVVSAPTQQFQLASFFDPDAPARPIRIALPIDTTPAGLRKFDKNTAFMISDVLCGQIQRAKGLGFIDLVRSVLPWPFHKDLDTGDMGPCADNIGMICSLSIPIVTICALILLMIFVSLLDIIFHWLPWFIVCFPVPGRKAKTT